MVSNLDALWLLPSPAMKLWKERDVFLTGAWHFTFLSSLITKQAVNNHLAVDIINSASIIAWRGEAGNFLRCQQGGKV